jgi:pimeloyl-ACP methyl ester carboxylesterase
MAGIPASGSSPAQRGTWLSEQYVPTTSIQQINAAAPLHAMPVTVLLGDKPEPADPPPTEYSVDFQDTVFRALREAAHQFGAGIPGAQVTTVPDTTHDVHTQRPDVVIAAIHHMVA